MKFQVTFYPYYTNYQGHYVQTDKSDKTEIMTKKQLKAIADLRHPVLNKEEFFTCQSTDIKGNIRQEFTLSTMGNYYLVIKPITI